MYKKLTALLGCMILTVSCSGSSLSKEQVLKLVQSYDYDAVVEKYGDNCLATTKAQLIKSTGAFAEDGEFYNMVSKYVDKEETTGQKLYRYFVSETYIDKFNTDKNKNMKVSYSKNGTSGFIINMNQTASTDYLDAKIEMKQTLKDIVGDEGLITSEENHVHFVSTGSITGEFEYTEYIEISLNFE